LRFDFRPPEPRTTPILPDDLPAGTSAGLLLSAIALLEAHGFQAPSTKQVLVATGAGRSTAYKVKAAIEGFLPVLLQPPGRPKAVPVEPGHPGLLAIAKALLAFSNDHPGCVSGTDARRRYSDGYRHLVLDLAEQHADLRLPDFADACNIPLPTLKDWLQGECPQVQPEPDLTRVPSPDPIPSQIQTLLAAWAAWDGAFVPFCTYVNFDLRLPFKRTLIAHILEIHGARAPHRRPGRSPDELALRGQFQTFFANAQWVGDGAQVKVQVDDEIFTFNLELDVDAYSSALVGAVVTPTEDAAAVVQAFDDGVATTGGPPAALLLDNKPSNQSDIVRDGIDDDTLLIRSTPGRPQSKPQVEGGFGLFSQEAPPLILITGTREQVALQVFNLVFKTWARAVNHRPMASHGGQSRVNRHLDHIPTTEEIAAARTALKELLRRQELARQTLAARQDPVVRATLTEAFERFGFQDPEGHQLTAIARYPLDAVVDAIATFGGKKSAGTLPPDVDARYLLGIAKNIAEKREGILIAEELLRLRLKVRDSILQPLQDRRSELEDQHTDETLLVAFVDNALAADRRIDRYFWLLAAADLISGLEPSLHPILLRLASRRIHSTFKVPSDERQQAIRFLYAKVLPID
jgi:hypothetical protein